MNISPIYQILGMILSIYILYFFVNKILKLPARMYAYLENMDKRECDKRFLPKK